MTLDVDGANQVNTLIQQKLWSRVSLLLARSQPVADGELSVASCVHRLLRGSGGISGCPSGVSNKNRYVMT